MPSRQSCKGFQKGTSSCAANTQGDGWSNDVWPRHCQRRRSACRNRISRARAPGQPPGQFAEGFAGGVERRAELFEHHRAALDRARRGRGEVGLGIQRQAPPRVAVHARLRVVQGQFGDFIAQADQAQVRKHLIEKITPLVGRAQHEGAVALQRRGAVDQFPVQQPTQGEGQLPGADFEPAQQ
jgi:hypothetical protein